MHDVVQHLKNIPLLQGLPDETLRALAAELDTRHLHTGDILFHKGADGDAIYIIRSGWVKIVTENSAGQELVLNHCGPGEVVGEMALIDREPRSAGVIALSPVDVLQLKRETFMQVLSRQPMLALDIMRNFSARLRFSTTYIEKAIEWSRRIAAGDYHLTIEDIESTSGIVDNDKADDVRAAELLSAFFEMVQGVRDREESLKQQLRQLSIEIDETKRRQAFEEVAQSPFYQDLKSSVQQIRRQQSGDEK
jgi:CRP-like cAMP-binding protein